MKTSIILFLLNISCFIFTIPAIAAPEVFIDVAPFISELSGAVFDEAAEMLYTLGDSGTGPVLGAMDTVTGETVARTVTGAENVDWEALTMDSEGYLWICDVGDNQADRAQVMLYQVDPLSILSGNETLAVLRSIAVTYPDGPVNVEAAVCENDLLYLIEKTPLLTPLPAAIYTVEISDTAPDHQEAAAFGRLTFTQAITDAALDTGGSLYFLTYFGLFIKPGWPLAVGPVVPVKYFFYGQQEALTLIDDDRFLIGVEAGPVYLIQDRFPLLPLR